MIAEKDGSYTINCEKDKAFVSYLGESRRKVLEKEFDVAKKQNALVLYLKLLFRGKLK